MYDFCKVQYRIFKKTDTPEFQRNENAIQMIAISISIYILIYFIYIVFFLHYAQSYSITPINSSLSFQIAYLDSYQASMMELLTVDYFCEKDSS